ncbi:hypothetical protein XAC2852_150004 [Xanthomonas citri pv. citri]|nr:hypothetical protein XAC2852_150004 [Xanthomonas citri pv. citri]
MRRCGADHTSVSSAACIGCSLAAIRILVGLRARRRVGQGQNLRQLVPKGIYLPGWHDAFDVGLVEDRAAFHVEAIAALHDEVEARLPPRIGATGQFHTDFAARAPGVARGDGHGARRDLVPDSHAGNDRR